MDKNYQREYWTIKFYEFITESEIESISQIPPLVLAFIQRIPYREMVRPFIIEEYVKRENSSRENMSERFGLDSYTYCRKIGEQTGVLKKRINK